MLKNKLPAQKLKKDVMPANQPNKSCLSLKSKITLKEEQGKQTAIIIKFWLPVLVCMGLIFYASSLPASEIPLLFPFQDILCHLLIYLSMAYFFSRALKKTYVNIVSAKIILYAVIFTTFYGITDEFHQSFIPGRVASTFDLFIDIAGGFFGTLFYR